MPKNRLNLSRLRADAESEQKRAAIASVRSALESVDNDPERFYSLVFVEHAITLGRSHKFQAAVLKQLRYYRERLGGAVDEVARSSLRSDFIQAVTTMASTNFNDYWRDRSLG